MNKPSIIFDKSFLQSLNLDESLVLDFLYQVNIVLVFFVEVLCDLEKKGLDPNEQDKIVKSLSSKTPKIKSSISLAHLHICQKELLEGYRVPFQNIPIVWSREKAFQINGEKHVLVESAPEIMIFQEWSEGKFYEPSRSAAKKYRNALEGGQLHARLFDLRQYPELQEYKQNDFEAFKKFAREIVYSDKSRLRLMKKALEFFKAPYDDSIIIIKEWKKLGAPALKNFAPYSAYVIFVSLFYQICEFKNPSLANRKSNWMDLSYLYYLPFCDIFVSNDKLHHKLIPHLAPELNCTFVSGEDMKLELSNLVKYFDELPEKPLRSVGEIFSLATYLPKLSAFHVAKLYDQKNEPRWRILYENLVNTMSPEKLKNLSKKTMKINEEIEEKLKKGEFSTNEDVGNSEPRSKTRFFKFQLPEK